MIRSAVPALAVLASVTLPGCGMLGARPNTSVTITNKITSLKAGHIYQFTFDVQHDQGAGVTLSLSGEGTLVDTGPTATYIAPPAVPSPDSVTVTLVAANGSGASDSDTFTIMAASGPVVSISPSTFTVKAGGPAVTLDVSVTEDDPTDTLNGGVSSSPGCNGICGSLGSFSGLAGGGAYTVSYTPPASVTMSTQQQVQVLSSLPGSTFGEAFVTINP